MKTFTQSAKFLLLAVLTAFTIMSCSDDDRGSTSTTGDVSFWNNDGDVGVITVLVGGKSAQVTSNVSPTECGQSGCANFNLTAGSYPFTASATTGETWSGNCTVESDGCLRFNLY